jgi:hypothetical protein
MKTNLRVAVAKKLFVPVYDGANDGGAANGGGAGEGQGQGQGQGDGKGGEPPGKPPGKVFTQEELDKIIDKRFAKEKSEKERYVAELKALRESSSLSETEKEKLSGRIDELEQSMLSVEQRAAQERASLEKKHANEVKKYQSEADTWKSRFHESTLSRELTDAAVSAGAEDPSQFVLMFRGLSRLDEEAEDGKPTGRFIGKIKFEGKDDEGKPTLVDLPIAQAFAKMKEWGLHKNLFRHQANPGTGQGAGGGQGGGGKDPSKMPMRESYSTEEAYRKAYHDWRNNYELDGTPIKK